MADEVPNDLKYTKTHEWVKQEGAILKVGITDHAQSELTDIVYVELPEIGKTVNKGDELCVVESVKSVSEIYAPVGGKITKINSALEDAPETINESPYENGWLVALTPSDSKELTDLLDAEEYKKIL